MIWGHPGKTSQCHSLVPEASRCRRLLPWSAALALLAVALPGWAVPECVGRGWVVACPS